MNLTDMVVMGAIALLAAFEAWTLGNKRANDTISESVWRVSFRRPLVPFLAGMVCGHFFWTPAGCEDIITQVALRAVEWLAWLV